MSRGKGRTEALNVDRTRPTTTGSPKGRKDHGDRVPVVGVLPKGDRTQGFTKKGVTRMSHSALLRLEALRKSRSCVWRAGCTKTVRRGTRCRIPDSVRRSSEDGFWVIRLT